MWSIRRHSGGPGPHGLGPEVVQFDAEGWAETNNPEAAEKAKLFPQAFTVIGPVEKSDTATDEAAESPPSPDHTQSSLEGTTVADLRLLATSLGIASVSGMVKADLIAAILAV